ncbi:MAG: 16S rRNA (cytosine(1402)-N(4))-methyltransferase RsmH [Rickettsiaceae bacterium]|nr:16S rRNA (cytosine(1402)-N(4))-methyltransferase RsmH [Rickettsiaceae bacterium]
MTQTNNKQILSEAAHCPVLLSEVLDNLAIKDGGNYLDCTFGAGGYTKAILERADCFVTALDQDPTVSVFADEVEKKIGQRFSFVQTNFAFAKERLQGKKFDGIVLDLGISSMQVDNAERGFSFMKDGPLDMRMGASKLSAEEFVANSDEEEIANIIYKYGEEVQSRQIAKAIVEARALSPITTTLQLADIIRNAMHFRKGKIDPATKTFQAIRIYINRELDVLEKFLNKMEDLLVPGGRILVVSFHSLEDSIVKAYFKSHSPKKVSRSKYSKEDEILEEGEWLRALTKKPLTPSRGEIMQNPRSRSSRLRVAEKIRGGK